MCTQLLALSLAFNKCSVSAVDLRREGLPLSLCFFKPGDKSENVKRRKKSKTIHHSPLPRDRPAHPEVLGQLGHQCCPPGEGKEMPYGC